MSLSILLFSIFLTSACLGILAQLIRQVPDPLMTLGASTIPWVTASYLLATFASKGLKSLRKAIVIGIVTTYIYLITWLFFYHLLFVLQENLSIEAGWRQIAPWLVAALLISPILGIVAAMTHKPGILGDMCLAVPIAWSLPEAFENLKDGWLDTLAIAIPIVVLVTLLIYIVKTERQVHVITLLAAVVILGLLAIVLYPTARGLIPD